MAEEPEGRHGTRESRTRTADDATGNSPSESASTSTPTSQDITPSLASRLHNSASGLVRSAFQGAGSPDPALTQSNATHAKATGPSASSSNTEASARASHEVSASVRGLAGGQENSGPALSESFRRGNTASTAQGGFALPPLTEDEFQLSHANIDTGSDGAGFGAGDWSHSSLQDETGSWKGKQPAYDPEQAAYNEAWERTQIPSPVDTQPPLLQSADGAAVVSLLSDSSFDPNFDPSTEDLNLDPAPSPPPLNTAEIDMLNSYRRELRLPTSNSRQEQPLSSLSLVPDIDTFLQQNDPQEFSTVDGNIRPTNLALRDAVLTYLPGAADWVDVQERYHDDVWGYLRPALEAAKEELEEKQDGSEHNDEDGPAVRRLKMILRHMKT